MHQKSTFTWRVPHDNVYSPKEALSQAPKLLEIAIKESRSIAKISLVQSCSEEGKRRFILNFAGCEFSGNITADSNDLIFSGERPRAGVFMARSMGRILLEQADKVFLKGKQPLVAWSI